MIFKSVGAMLAFSPARVRPLVALGRDVRAGGQTAQAIPPPPSFGRLLKCAGGLAATCAVYGTKIGAVQSMPVDGALPGQAPAPTPPD